MGSVVAEATRLDEEMLDRLTAEGLITLTEALALFPPAGVRGRRPSVITIGRYIRRGLIGPDGTRVRLEAVRLFGNRIATSEAAVRRFLAALRSDANA